MKRNWTVRRTTVARADAARRWDQAYLHLLRWAATEGKPPMKREVPDARGDLRPGFDPAPSAGRDSGATLGHEDLSQRRPPRPVLSTHETFVKSSGLRWVCVMLLVEVPWARTSVGLALPFPVWSGSIGSYRSAVAAATHRNQHAPSDTACLCSTVHKAFSAGSRIDTRMRMQAES